MTGGFAGSEWWIESRESLVVIRILLKTNKNYGAVLSPRFDQK